MHSPASDSPARSIGKEQWSSAWQVGKRDGNCGWCSERLREHLAVREEEAGTGLVRRTGYRGGYMQGCEHGAVGIGAVLDCASSTSVLPDCEYQPCGTREVDGVDGV